VWVARSAAHQSLSVMVTLGFADPPMECTELLSLVRLVPSSGSGATLYLPEEVEELCLEASNPSGPPGKYRVYSWLIRSNAARFVHGAVGMLSGVRVRSKTGVLSG